MCKVRSEIGILDEHAPDSRIGLERLSAYEECQHGVDIITGLPTDLHGDPQPLYLSFAPQDRVADRHGLALRINERDDLPPTASDEQRCCDMSRGVGVRFVPTD